MSKIQKQDLKRTFKSYKHVTREMVKLLQSYGLVVEGQGKHYKIYRLDRKGGFVTLAKSPSDHRTGMNISGYLIALIELNDDGEAQGETCVA